MISPLRYSRFAGTGRGSGERGRVGGGVNSGGDISGGENITGVQEADWL